MAGFDKVDPANSCLMSPESASRNGDPDW